MMLVSPWDPEATACNTFPQRVFLLFSNRKPEAGSQNPNSNAGAPGERGRRPDLFRLRVPGLHTPPLFSGIRGEALWLVLILGLEIWVFSGSFDRFFNHDSLFYLIHAPQSWTQLVALITGPDPTQQYRPMTLAVMGLFRPLFGLNPAPYHWIPLAFHLANTILFWRLARRLIGTTVGTLAAVAFWGLHSVAAFVIYDIGYFPDFLMAFFGLASLILALDAFERGSRLRGCFAILLYIGALLSKEAMVALPLALMLSLVMSALRQDTEVPKFPRLAGILAKAAPLVVVYLGIAVIHAVRLLYWLQSGRLYAQGANAAYDIDPLRNLAGKAVYLYWAFNLPDALVIAHPYRNRALALLLMGLLLTLWGFDLLRRRLRLAPVEVGGLIWLLGMLVPAYMLSSRTAKWYLYVPLMGLALAAGAAAASIEARLQRLPAGYRRPGVLALFLAPMLFSSAVQTRSFLNSSDSAYASTVVQNCLADFREIHPTLPPRVTLYLLRTFEKDVSDFFGGGHLYSLYYPESEIQMLFADKGDALPPDFAERDDIRIAQYLYAHVYDVSDYYKGRRRDSGSVRLITDLEKVEATVDRSEFYPSYESFGTPGGGPVFFPTPDKDIFTQIGGSTAIIALGAVPPGAELRFDISWMHDQGDGGWAQLSLQWEGREESLFRRYMKPNPAGRGLHWEEVKLDLAAYAGREVRLVLSCRNSPGNTTIADWLNWRDLRLK